MDLTRLRVTSVSKLNLPSIDEVRNQLKAIQKQIDDGGYQDDDVFNPDETATRPGAAPLYQLTFKNMRGAAINSNSMLKNLPQCLLAWQLETCSHHLTLSSALISKRQHLRLLLLQAGEEKSATLEICHRQQF